MAALLLLALALLPACSGGDEASGPGGAVQRFYEHLNSGDIAGAKSLYNAEALKLLNDPDFSSEEGFANWAKEHTKDGSISGVTILGTEALESGGNRVEFQINYDDGSSTTAEVTATEENGEWKLGLLG
jgi:hypothetical protein